METDAKAAGMDPTRLARIDEHLRRNYVERGRVAGCQVAVMRRGAVAHYSAVGFADRERGVPVAEDTIWRIYSMTKPISAVALMTLYERGMFALSDPVSRFIPSWANLQVAEVDDSGATRLVEPSRPVQIRDLMMHTAGIGYGLANADLEVEALGTRSRARFRIDPDLEAMAERLGQTPLRFHPGRHWLYSLGLDVCGRLVEIMSGKRFDEYLEAEIFAPLGMSDTAFYVKSQDVPRFAEMRRRGGELDGRRILGLKTVELMTINHLPGGATMPDFALPGGYGEAGFEGKGFGLSMAVSAGPAQAAVIGSAGEYMWGGAASTTFWVDPAEDLVVVFMTQFLPSGTFNFAGQLRALVYPAIVD